MGGWMPAWAVPYLNTTYVLDLLNNPFNFYNTYLGAELLGSGLATLIIFASWMHTKSLLGAGIVSLLLAPALEFVGELHLAAVFALGFGMGAVIWELIKRVV